MTETQETEVEVARILRDFGSWCASGNVLPEDIPVQAEVEHIIVTLCGTPSTRQLGHQIVSSKVLSLIVEEFKRADIAIPLERCFVLKGAILELLERELA